MRKIIEQYELVKEIKYILDGADIKLIGRIYKIIQGPNAKYMWGINYYCRLKDEAGIYIPSSPFGNSNEDTENKLASYIKRFETAVEWKKDSYF